MHLIKLLYYNCV